MTKIIAGIDEAGRGPLAGPVMAACVVLDPHRPIDGLKDSKLLTPEKRDKLYDMITEHSLYWAVAVASVQEIDTINILQASLLAMQRAYVKIDCDADLILVDGKDKPNINGNVQAEVNGDQRFAEISAASIVAKVYRDRFMVQLHKKYPQYEFAQHKGYPTALHLERLRRYGCCPEHRKSFKPVKLILLKENKG